MHSTCLAHAHALTAHPHPLHTCQVAEGAYCSFSAVTSRVCYLRGVHSINSLGVAPTDVPFLRRLFDMDQRVSWFEFPRPCGPSCTHTTVRAARWSLPTHAWSVNTSLVCIHCTPSQLANHATITMPCPRMTVETCTSCNLVMEQPPVPNRHVLSRRFSYRAHCSITFFASPADAQLSLAARPANAPRDYHGCYV